jgi:hypothetical protein
MRTNQTPTPARARIAAGSKGHQMDTMTPYEVSKLAGCLPQYCYNLVGKGVGALGKNARKVDDGEGGKVWAIDREVGERWAAAYKARKAARQDA